MSAAVREWLVAADDRTGAFEVAALFAEVVGPVTVTVGEPPTDSGVVDIGSRTSTATEAARVAAAIDASPSAWVAHKIDSTLRGNWAAEVVARQGATDRRAVLLPGWPEMGRTCVGGVVFVDGKRVGSVRDHLKAELLMDVDELRAWLKRGGTLAVCDVPSTEAMHAAASALAGRNLLVAGPAGPLGAVFAAGREPRPHTPVHIGSPVLVVCGSANPVAREQLQRVRAAMPDVEILATAVPDGELHAQAVAELAADARRRLDQLQPQTTVIVGGETAAALLGDTPQIVTGSAAPGMPFIRRDDGSLVITKAGGFGGQDALVTLLRGDNG